MLMFVGGFILGGLFGIMLMAVIGVAEKEDEKERRDWYDTKNR